VSDSPTGDCTTNFGYTPPGKVWGIAAGLVAMVYVNPLMTTLFVSLGVVGYLYFLTTARRRTAAATAAADLS
jgi:hypothetical protein